MYDAENVKDLAEKLEYVINNINLYEIGVKKAFEDYKEKHSLKYFAKRYEHVILHQVWEKI